MNGNPQTKNMKTMEIIESSQKFIEPYRVTNGKNFGLRISILANTGESTTEDKPRAKELLEKGVEVLAELQDVLYAQDQWSILLILGVGEQRSKMLSSAFCRAFLARRRGGRRLESIWRVVAARVG
jgi:hypothetical protein